MADSSSPIELEEFELIPSAPGAALLRVTARVPAWAPREPTLLIRDGSRVHRVRPLPLPREPEGWLRAAYSVRTAVLERSPSFALELSQGAVIQLPEPRGRPRRSRPALTHPRASEMQSSAALPLRNAPVAQTGRPDSRQTARPDSRQTGPPDSWQTGRPDSRTVVELQAKVLEANRWALDAQREVERLTVRIRELEGAAAQVNPLERIRQTAIDKARAADQADVRAALVARRQL